MTKHTTTHRTHALLQNVAAISAEFHTNSLYRCFYDAFADNIEAIRQWLQHTFGLVLFDESFYLLAEMPSHITWVDVAVISAMAMFFSLAASIYPAARAARLDPVEGLRRE